MVLRKSGCRLLLCSVNCSQHLELMYHVTYQALNLGDAVVLQVQHLAGNKVLQTLGQTGAQEQRRTKLTSAKTGLVNLLHPATWIEALKDRIGHSKVTLLVGCLQSCWSIQDW